MKVLTVKELIAKLKAFPENTPVFGYSEMDEGDFPVEIVEYAKAEFDEDEGIYIVPHGCQADSSVDEYWSENGIKPIVYVRARTWREF